jgi:transposase-like protein
VARTTYTDADKARAYVVLTANDGLVKRAARELDIPENTLRRWRDEWEKSGPPALEEVEAAVGEFIDRAVSVRDDALAVISMKLQLLKRDPEKAKLAELSTVFGILQDKIDRAAGLGNKNQVDHFHHLPPADEIRELMQGFVAAGIATATQRSEDIVDAEIVEQAPQGELPPPRP